MGPSKTEVLSKLRGTLPKRHLPIHLGQYEVKAIIRFEDDQWQLVSMKIDEAKAKAEGKRRMAAGEPWMPEMRGRFNEPHKVLASAASAKQLADILEGKRFRFLKD